VRIHGLILIFVVVLLAAAPASAADRLVERGIVQSLDEAAIVLRALDGSEVTVALRPDTRARLNGVETTLSAIRPGHVAVVVLGDTGEARVVRAFGRVARGVDRGVIVTATRLALVLRPPGGARVAIELTRRTTVRRGALAVARRALRAGQQVEVIRAGDGTARIVTIGSSG